MNDEKVVSLLEEIRDLQKQHVENYKEALKNQQEVVLLQKEAVARQKVTLRRLFIIMGIFLGLSLLLSLFR